MSGKKALIVLCLSNGLFLFLDRFLKWQATHDWSAPRLVGKYFGWQPFFNPGIGFGLPVPNVVTIFLTGVILFLIAFLFFKQVTSEGVRYKVLGISSLSLVFIGALSNLVDRIFFGYTVDYIFTVTGYINIADILILAGFIIYIIKTSKHENIKTV